MQDGGSGGGGIIELARKAAASVEAERAARLAAARHLVRKYRGVHRRANRYFSVIRSTGGGRLQWLGSYDTPEEAAYAYDAAARAIRGHRARPNFPEPAQARAAPAPQEVSTDLVLALPAPAREPGAPAAHYRFQQNLQQPVALHPQACFDNWLAASPGTEEPQDQQQQGGAPAPSFPHHHQQQQRTVPLLPPFTQFFHLSGPAPATAAGDNGDAAAAVVNPSVPGAYVLTPENVQVPPATNPASTELSSTDEPVVDALQFLPAAAAPTQHRDELPVSQVSGVSDLAVVADNFSRNGSFSSAARPRVARFRLDLLLHVGLPGRGGLGGGAQ